MKNGFKTIRIGHSAVGHQRTTKRDECATGGLYKSPAKGQSVDVSEPVTVTWDTSCLDTDAVDLYLYAPSVAKPVLHEWESVNYKAGSYNATLKAGWWNYTSPINLEFTIVPSGQPLFMVTTPAGPLFSATYSGTDHSSSAVAGAVEQVNNTVTEKHGLSKGAVAAAVIIPLLIAIALVSAAYIRINRQKGKEKRKRFSQVVDKRMSTISTDWKSITPAGANAAIRNSMAIPGNRSSSFSFGGIRPMSTVAVEGGQAGIGARGVMDQDSPADAPQMSQLRPGLRTSAFENRVSRVSFAADPRPSVESRRARQSRSFHNGYVPPLPERQYSTESSSNASPILSPIQTAGPLSLTAEDIRARMTGQEANARPSIDEMMPALSMMRNGEFEGGELLFQAPMPPSPTHQTPTSPIMGAMPMQPMPANVMSPDDMLRAYAERRAMGATSPGAPAVPTPAANYNGTGMRTLYSPDHAASPAIPAFPEATYAAPTKRKSLAPTEYGEDDAYVGTAE
ncbi:hypothetical protein K466DRAFT_491184 [Polyporus arcularius HHB13444]|uniref:Uncharacterized protein n=1 Tax=Polyporus arcularius HHB13444 TaxID=1314778 RepID=A0A5C3PDZ7_9APHY|nr:hypothetical protein K466DRAFT_491184 [Polyporus arcularius HHB13444]